MAFRRQSQNCCLGVGANNVSYLADITQPLFSYFGTGIVPGMPPAKKFKWRIFQGEQFYVNPANRISGLPGVVSGQFAMQPLIDTRVGVNGL